MQVIAWRAHVGGMMQRAELDLPPASAGRSLNLRMLRAHHPPQAKAERAEQELKGHTEAVTAIQWRPNQAGEVLASNSEKSVRFWDVRTGKCAGNVTMASTGNTCIAWSPDGNTLAVASNAKENTVAFIDARKYKVAKTCKVQTEVREQWGAV